MLASQTNSSGQQSTVNKEFKSFKGLKSEVIANLEERTSLEDEGSRVIRRNSRGRPKQFEEIDTHGKEQRGRSSELGISNKYHRRLQTTDTQDPSSNIIEIAKESSVLSDPEDRRQPFAPEGRRARSSLSNRHPSSKEVPNILSPTLAHQHVKGPAVSGAIMNTSQLMNHT